MNFPKSDLGRFPVNARPLRSDPWGLCLVKTIRRLMMKRYNVDTLTIEQFRDLIASGDDSRANQIRITKDREIFLSPIVGAVSLQNIIGRFETFDKDNHCLHGSGKWNKHYQDTKNRCGNPGYSDEKRIAASIVARTWRTIFVALSYTKRHHPRAERYLEIMELFRQRVRPTHGGARRRGTNLTTRHCTRSNDLLSPAYLLHRFATSGSSY